MSIARLVNANMTKKRILMIVIPFLAGVLALCITISLTGGRFVGILPGVDYTDELTAGSIPVGASNADLVAAAYEILEYMKSGEYEHIGNISNPETGVLFSPYATISTQSARVFTPSEIKAFARDKRSYVWGIYYESGEPIEMTSSDYFARFVFDRDFTRAKLVGIKHIVRSGNSLENISEVFPDMRYIDFHIPSSDADDMNWGSLRLGFTAYGESLMLSLVLHSEYTI